MGKADQNKKAKRESLLNTAFELFTTQGIQRTSISDIVKKAGVAKGTFYLYFTDKYDIRNYLISHKSNLLFSKAFVELLTHTELSSFEDRFLFLIDYIIDELNENQSLLTFISKNLDWGIFKSVISSTAGKNTDFYDIYLRMLSESNIECDDAEIMLFLIVELVGSSCYSTILYQKPVDINQLKPHLYNAIRSIIRLHTD